MSSDKLLSRIQLQIDELAPLLELFVDDTIQPSVKDCESLQKQLTAMQEGLAVYKYNKQNKELSPSFNIHAKVSEKEVLAEKKETTVKEMNPVVVAPIIQELEEIKEVESVISEPKKTEVPVAEPRKVEVEKIEIPTVEIPTVEIPKIEPLKARLPLAVGINDKFRFINELFSQNSSEYNIALEQINNVTQWYDAEIYLNSLKSVYGWNDKEEVVSYFFLLVKKRFD